MFKVLCFLLPFVGFSKVALSPESMLRNAKGTFLQLDEAGGDWFNSSPDESIEGASVNKVYEEFGAPKNEIIVAVIDSGVDVNHEDLKGKIWINKNEIPNDGKDNDGNGYIDDYYGWNFLGSKLGMGKVLENKTFIKGEDKYQVNDTNLEFARELKRLGELNRDLTQEEKDLIVKLKKYERETCDFMTRLQRPYWCDGDHTNLAKDLVAKEKKKVKKYNYGNNDIIGPDSSHGTHVAGIIAANRKNNLGMKGVASNVKIMAIRAVPNGDELDEDVANAIVYAVDNGAKVINMSFGKAFSPKKSMVNRAVKYARKNGVLLVHAAGNDGKENFIDNNFPNKRITKKTNASNWIEVGASSRSAGSRLSANFSNYSEIFVDLFAPGVGIYSTTPNNRYKSFSGTSMASPVVAGCAALLLGYDNTLEAKEIRAVLNLSVKKYEGLEVDAPLNGFFEDLSKTGGIIDIYKAVKSIK